MTESDGSVRFTSLDAEKYGKNFTFKFNGKRFYSQGMTFNASEILDLTSKSESVSECNKLSKMLNGGLSVALKIDNHANVEDDQKIHRKSIGTFTFLQTNKK